MKKLIIITYYWPPMGGSGVQRWLKFAKYLPEFGWEPIIYTPKNPSFQLYDASLMEDVREGQIVWKKSIWEPHHLFYAIKGQKDLSRVNQTDILEKKDKSWLERLGIWMRGNLLLPDPRLFWVFPSVKFLTSKIKEHHIDAIVTTGPPHSVHFIGKKLKDKTGIPWLADFRDPWSRWIMLDSFNVSGWAMRIHQRLERTILRNADARVTVSNTWKRDFEALGGELVHYISNGYDEEDFVHQPASDKHNRFLISHIGTVDTIRDPRMFLTAVRELCQEQSDFSQDVQLRFVGYLSGIILKEIQEDTLLSDKLVISQYVPHQEIPEILRESYVQLLLLNAGPETRGILTGKFFEYLASGKRILALGRVGDEVDLALQKTQAGFLHHPDDKEGIKSTLMQFYRDYQQDTPFAPRHIADFSRKKLTQQLAELLDHTTQR